ncbi:hypothetical protein [Kineobactrum salinum]|uniref:Uncharacterized protein n=1 Tax=Kineobactrum salinum TaxID=2708301 RepID=A0A6C0U6L2_9GAMM|nr:hypothetical protein [Kineobactrum salinum]QIB65084.1 hypothetical protein G3T16_06390 [Kineobactrum salinum]
MRYLAHAAFVIAASFAIIALLGQDFFNRWAGFLSIAAIPMMVMLNIFCGGDAPRQQPRTGLRLLAVATLAGAVVAGTVLVAVQGELATPSIVAVMFVIFGVVVMMWLALVFAGWPATAAKLGGWRTGLLLWTLAYVIAALLYPLLFDFTAFGPAGAGFEGWFPAWDCIVFCITTLGVIFALSLFEQMPLTVAHRLGQPWTGLITAVAVLLLAGLLMGTFTGLVGVDVVAFMVAGPVAFMFGVFMVTDVAGGRFLSHRPQPLRGLALLVASSLAGLVLYLAYGQAMALMAPGQSSGGPTYAAELWLANAMLSITFPVILIHMNLFDGWPLPGPGQGQTGRAPELRPEKGAQAYTGE